LRLLHRAGLLNPQVARIWSDEKPLEELYDLQEDPFELKISPMSDNMQT